MLQMRNPMLRLLCAILLFASAAYARHSSGGHSADLFTRATCRTIKVVSGDSCASLAKRCAITAANFTKYNPNSKLCSTLVPGQQVCCSAGTLPNNAPKPNADGSCATYAVKSGDTCAEIAATHSLTTTQVNTFNAKTWAWNGCDELMIAQKICLSTGTPPMPAPIPGAVCGPQKPGTLKPAAGVALSSLNPCPLNACCDVGGQCGATPEFCVATSTGPPGTAKAGTNGCISNCGTDIISSASPPSPFRKVGYFEGDNLNRPCVNMDIGQVNASAYTHLHFAFATLSSNFEVIVSDDAYTQYEFARFKNITGPIKMLTIGGWDFSTNPSTYMIFRNGVLPANANTLAQNIYNFVVANGLGGVDIDWEYPGETGMAGIPAGTAADGTNFESFLKILKTKLGAKKLSVAVPATYFYLKAYPILSMSATVDYINFMTYDLHSSSQLGAEDGCPAGNCIRSPINTTEINYALSMITKAGVPSNKIAVGVTSYGGSFLMSKAGCTGPMCTWTGSPLAGRCTQASGTLADAEIKEIISTNKNIQQIHDVPSNTDILVYNSTQWVGYMSYNTKYVRTQRLMSINFGGFVDWALDEQNFLPSPAYPFHPSTEWQSDWDVFKAAVLNGSDPLST